MDFLENKAKQFILLNKLFLTITNPAVSPEKRGDAAKTLFSDKPEFWNDVVLNFTSAVQKERGGVVAPVAISTTTPGPARNLTQVPMPNVAPVATPAATNGAANGTSAAKSSISALVERGQSEDHQEWPDDFLNFLDGFAKGQRIQNFDSVKNSFAELVKERLTDDQWRIVFQALCYAWEKNLCILHKETATTIFDYSPLDQLIPHVFGEDGVLARHLNETSKVSEEELPSPAFVAKGYLLADAIDAIDRREDSSGLSPEQSAQVNRVSNALAGVRAPDTLIGKFENIVNADRSPSREGGSENDKPKSDAMVKALENSGLVAKKATPVTGVKGDGGNKKKLRQRAKETHPAPAAQTAEGSAEGGDTAQTA